MRSLSLILRKKSEERAVPGLGGARAVFLVAVGGVVAVVERELLGAGLAVPVRPEERYPTPAAAYRVTMIVRY